MLDESCQVAILRLESGLKLLGVTLCYLLKLFHISPPKQPLGLWLHAASVV